MLQATHLIVGEEPPGLAVVLLHIFVAHLAFTTFQYSPFGVNSWTTIGAPDTIAPYSVAWNDTALAAGHYDLHVKTADNAGNTSTSAIVTVVVPPHLKFTIGKAKVTFKGTKAFITLPTKASATVTVRATLYRGKKIVYRWSFRVKRGSRNISLVLPRSRLKVAAYILSEKATSSDTQSVKRTAKFRVKPLAPTF
jgi:hypothetical protein